MTERPPFILFQDDWRDAEGRLRAVPHVETGNFSFKRICMVYRAMGIRNHLFPLALTQPDLERYDPHDLRDESLELKKRIAHEIEINPWYFLREVLRIPAPGGAGTQFEAHRGNVSMAWSFFAGFDYFSVQPRQTGKTIGKLGLDTWVLYFHGRSLIHALLTKDSKLRQENVSRIKSMRDLLPKWLIHHQTQDEDNKEGLHYKELRNTYKTHVGLADRIKASGVGRGDTYITLHFDEAGFISNIKITHAVIVASHGEGRLAAKKEGMVHAKVYTTTAAPTSTESGEYAYGLLSEGMPFTEKIYDCANVQEASDLLEANSTNMLLNGTWSYLQLGKTKEWFIQQTRSLGASEEDIDRDFLNIWKADTALSVLSKEVVRKMRLSAIEPVHLEIDKNGYVFNWYIPKDEIESLAFQDRSLVLAMDSSENIGRDFTALVLLDPATMSTVATFRCNESNLIRLGETVGDFLVRHPRVVFIPERKSSGPALIDQIVLILRKNGFNPFFRIFNSVVQERMEKINVNDPNLAETVAKKYLGFQTTGASRPYLYKNVLNKATRLNHRRILDRTIITELSSLNVVKGRIDHVSGAHDDLAIAYLLACWLIYEGRQLHVYGLEVQNFLIEADEEGTSQKVKEQAEIKTRIAHYEGLEKAASTDLMKAYYASRLTSLKSRIDDTLVSEPMARDQFPGQYRPVAPPSQVDLSQVKRIIHSL